MNSLRAPLLLSVMILAGMLTPSTSQAQFTEARDIDLSPPVMYSRAYAPDHKAFEACWKSIPQDKTFASSSKFELGGTVFFRYESAAHHFRSVVSKVSSRTFVALTHFDERGHKGDLLTEVSQAQDLAPEHLGRYLEYLPLGAETGLLTEGYPLTATGAADHEILLRDLEPAAHRMYLPEFKWPETDDKAVDPPFDDKAWEQERAKIEEAIHSRRLVNFYEETATNGLYALPRAYSPNKEVFEALWKNRPVVHGLKRSAALELFCEPSTDPPDPLAYQDGAGHHQAILLRFGRIHYFMIVRFSDPAKDDLVIYLGFPYEHRELLAQRLAHAAEYLPYSLNVDQQHKNYAFLKNGYPDGKVVWRDFYSIPSRPYTSTKFLFPEPRVLTAAEKAHHYLPDEEAEKLARPWCEIRVTDCKVSDLSLIGLVEVANQTLKAAHRPERVHLRLPDIRKDADLDHFVQSQNIGEPFGPPARKGRLDRQKLMEEINRGSLFDLLNNLNYWTGHQISLFSDGIFIDGGGNWPKLPDKREYYSLIFK